jgi:phosphomannomutase
MKETMRREDCIGGGELSGHFYFAENYYTDCGVLACILVLNQLSKEGLSLKGAADPLRRYYGTGEINFRVDDKAALMQKIEDDYSDGEIDHLDGVTITFPDWWVNVRPSNTEPYLRMCLEADVDSVMQEKKAELIAILGKPV